MEPDTELVAEVHIAAIVRRHPRALFSVPFTLNHLSRGGSVKSTRGVSLDIAEGGLGALVEGNLVVGETVSFDLRVREYPLVTAAIVRHTSQLRSGFEFLRLSPDERLQIANVDGYSRATVESPAMRK